MAKLASSSASVNALVFALAAFSASHDAFARGPRWEGIDRHPISSRAALADFKEMIEERCRKGWFAPPLTHEACYERLKQSEGCDAKVLKLMAPELNDRNKVIAFAKVHSECVFSEDAPP